MLSGVFRTQAMKTRFTPLVKLKKDAMDKCENELQQAHFALSEARTALEAARRELESAAQPRSGSVSALQQSRALIGVQRAIVTRESDRVATAQAAVERAREALKQAMIEHEKFKYLEADAIKRYLLEQKRRSERDLDEIAVQNYSMRNAT